MSSRPSVFTAITVSATEDVRLKLKENSPRWSLGCTEKAVISKSPPRFSMISSAWLMSPESKR